MGTPLGGFGKCPAVDGMAARVRANLCVRNWLPGWLWYGFVWLANPILIAAVRASVDQSWRHAHPAMVTPKARSSADRRTGWRSPYQGICHLTCHRIARQ